MTTKTRGRKFFDVVAIVTLVGFVLFSTSITLGTVLICQ